MRQYTSKNDEQELSLQKEYMRKAASYVDGLAEQLGRRPLCCVTTFGCQMNARDSEKAYRYFGENWNMR